MVCLEPECIESMPANKQPKNKKDDYCPICYSASITQEPSVALNCGHVFHASCIKDQILKGYNGPRIIFNYLDCPQCKQRMKFPNNKDLQALIDKEEAFEKEVIKKTMERAKFEDLHKHKEERYKREPFNGDL